MKMTSKNTAILSRAGVLALLATVSFSSPALALIPGVGSVGGVGGSTEVTLGRNLNAVQNNGSKIDSTRDAVNGVRDSVNDVKGSVDGVDQRIQQLSDTLLQALREQSGENSSYLDKQIEAQRRFTDAASQNDTDRLRQQYRADAESGALDPIGNSCVIADLFSGSNSGGTVAGPGKGSEASSSVRARMSGADPAVQAGGTALAASVVEAIKPYKGRADGTSDIAVILEDPTVDMSDPEVAEIITRLIQNGIEPLPPKPISARELRTPEGQSRAAARQAVLTRYSAALETIAFSLNLRDPVIDSTSYDALASESAYNRLPLPDTISELQAIDLRVVADYAPTPEAMAKRNIKSEKEFLADILNQTAISNRIAYLQLELDTRRAIVEGYSLATANN